MQLLSRRKVKRPVVGAGRGGGKGDNDGDEYRGFMYAYRLNKQGRSYVDYLKRTYFFFFFDPELQDHTRGFELRTNLQSMLAINEIEKRLGENLDDLDKRYVEYVYLHSKNTAAAKSGRHKRFPVRISFEFVKELVERKRKLEQENRKLKADLEACRRHW